MENQEAIDYLNNLQQGMFCTVNIPICNNTEKIPITAMYMGKDKEGRYIRRERYSGSMSRSFYVGSRITEPDIHAKYENGILTLNIPKEDEKAIEKKRFIEIEG